MKWVQRILKQCLHHCFNFYLAAVSGLNPTFWTTHLKDKSCTMAWSLPDYKVLNKSLHTHYTDRVGYGSQFCMDICKKELHSGPFWYRVLLTDFWVCNTQWFHPAGLNVTFLRTQSFNLCTVNCKKAIQLKREISSGCFTKARHFQVFHCSVSWAKYLKLT